MWGCGWVVVLIVLILILIVLILLQVLQEPRNDSYKRWCTGLQERFMWGCGRVSGAEGRMALGGGISDSNLYYWY